MYRHDSAPRRMTTAASVTSPTVTGVWAIGVPERLVEQELDQGHVDFPDPGDREHGQARDGIGAKAPQPGGEVVERHVIVVVAASPWPSLAARRSIRAVALASEPWLAAPSPR